MGKETESVIAFLVFWSALIVSGWVVVACSRRSCLGPAKISSFVLWFNSRMGTQGESKMSSFCFWYESTEWRFWVQEGGFKIFLCGPRDRNVLIRSLDLPRAAKKICLGSEVWGMCRIRGHKLIFFFLFLVSGGFVALLSSI